jgi:hypothetical protein
MFKFEVGDKVFISFNQNFSAKYYKITKVSKKSATINLLNFTINLETGHCSDKHGATYGTIYESEAAYLYDKALKKDWQDLRSKISNAYNIPANITIDDIEAIYLILNKASV